MSSVLPLLATLTKTDTTVAAGSLTIPFGALSATVAHALLRVDALDVAIAGLADTAPGMWIATWRASGRRGTRCRER